MLSSPIWLYQIFAFLVPGLTGREKRYTFGFFFSAVPLFLARLRRRLVRAAAHRRDHVPASCPTDATTFFEAKTYLDFVLKLVLAIGHRLRAAGVPRAAQLRRACSRGSAILKGWRWAILAITLFTAIATPAADVISMFLLAIPMVVLYFAAVGVSLWHDRAVARRADALEASLSGA